jgi:hypothetical protein
MRPVPVLWHEMSVKYIGPKYVDPLNIRSQHSHSNLSDKWFYTGKQPPQPARIP